jgi:hypothetical protein
LGRILVVSHPSAATIQSAVLLQVSVGDVITLLGAPFWLWHNSDLLEGSFALATNYHLDSDLEDRVTPLFLLGTGLTLRPPDEMD